MKLFLDTEFTGLHQATTLISIALYADENNYFYAELNDYDKGQVTPWIEENVISKLEFNDIIGAVEISGTCIKIKANKATIALRLSFWLKQFDTVEIWADVLAYDWVLFCDLFGGALGIPENIFYAPFDLATAFRLKGLIEPHSKYEQDVKRLDFIGLKSSKQHHALEDAKVDKLCFEKLMTYDKPH